MKEKAPAARRIVTTSASVVFGSDHDDNTQAVGRFLAGQPGSVPHMGKWHPIPR
jgi:hypothetical protein